MMVRVQYQNCRYDYVDTHTLNKLLKRKGIIQFYRPSEERWVHIEHDAIRGLNGGYSGFERRRPHNIIKFS